MTISVEERLAVAEERITTLAGNSERILAKLEDMDRKLSRQSGFWGAVMMIGGALWAFLTFTWDHVATLIKG